MGSMYFEKHAGFLIFEILRLRNEETKKPRNQDANKPRNQKTKQPRNQETKKL